MAALKLSQTEYRGRLHFTKTIAGSGPYDLRLTFRRFLEWQTMGEPLILLLFAALYIAYRKKKKHLKHTEL